MRVWLFCSLFLICGWLLRACALGLAACVCVCFRVCACVCVCVSPPSLEQMRAASPPRLAQSTVHHLQDRATHSLMCCFCLSCARALVFSRTLCLRHASCHPVETDHADPAAASCRCWWNRLRGYGGTRARAGLFELALRQVSVVLLLCRNFERFACVLLSVPRCFIHDGLLPFFYCAFTPADLCLRCFGSL